MPTVKLSPFLEQVLKKAKLEGNEITILDAVILPKLDKEKLHQLMINMGGRSTDFITYKFPFNPIRLFEKVKVGISVNIATDYQYFPTNENVVKEFMIRGLDIFGKKALEPSAGDGAIARVLRDCGANVFCVELMQEMREALLMQDFELIGNDFMELPLWQKFDLIVSNPPFTNFQDMKHIRKMYEHLNEKGQLRAIMSSTNFGSNNKTALSFRNWLDKIGTSENLGKGLFSELGTQVSVTLISIDK